MCAEYIQEILKKYHYTEKTRPFICLFKVFVLLEAKKYTEY